MSNAVKCLNLFLVLLLLFLCVFDIEGRKADAKMNQGPRKTLPLLEEAELKHKTPQCNKRLHNRRQPTKTTNRPGTK
jgi:hypothetical protein